MASGIGASGAAGRRLKSLSGGPGSAGRALWALTPLPVCRALQEGLDALPDALQAPLLLQARGAAAVQRLDQQQDRQAVLPPLLQMVRGLGAVGERPPPTVSQGKRPQSVQGGGGHVALVLPGLPHSCGHFCRLGREVNPCLGCSGCRQRCQNRSCSLSCPAAHFPPPL